MSRKLSVTGPSIVRARCCAFRALVRVGALTR